MLNGATNKWLASLPGPRALGLRALLLGTWTIGGLTTPLAAQECNNAPMPAAPATVRLGITGQTFGNTPPLVPFSQTSGGLPGCVGANGGETGGAGAPGIRPAASLAARPASPSSAGRPSRKTRDRPAR